MAPHPDTWMHSELPPIRLEEGRWVLRLADRLPGFSRTRKCALQVLDGKRVEQAELPNLIRTLMNPDVRRWRERALAAWTLARVSDTPEEAAETARRLREVLEDRLPTDPIGAAYSRCLIAGGALAGMFAAAISTSVFASETWMQSDPVGVGILALTVCPLWMMILGPCALLAAPFVIPLSRALDRMRGDRVRAAAASALGHLGDVESLSSLAAIACVPYTEMSRAAQEALSHILPLLRPEHAETMTGTTQDRLARLLDYCDSDPRFLAILLRALAVVGDGRTVWRVHWLAANGQTDEVRAEAERALPILQERRRRQADAETLLRAAGHPEASTRLLRPMGSLNTADPDTLLRAHGG